MSSKAKLFPLSGTEQISWQMPVQGDWGSVPAEPRDMQFLRSWLVYDSDILTQLHEGAGWNRLLGLAMSVIVSAGIWVGVGVTVARMLK